MARWHRGALGSGGHPGAPVSPDHLGSLPSQEIMVGPQFQADLSGLQLDRHGEKCKWGLVVVGDGEGETREPHQPGRDWPPASWSTSQSLEGI